MRAPLPRTPPLIRPLALLLVLGARPTLPGQPPPVTARTGAAAPAPPPAAPPAPAPASAVPATTPPAPSAAPPNPPPASPKPGATAPGNPPAAAPGSATAPAAAIAPPPSPASAIPPAAQPPPSAAPPVSPPPAPAQPADAAPAEPEPLYSMEIVHQDAETAILEYARRAHKTVSFLDRYSTHISALFHDQPFEKGLRKLLQAADLDFVKDDGGYVVGLPNDLKLRFPRPEDQDKVVDAAYRCRRISAPSLVRTILSVMGDAQLRAAVGPEFLTPAVESANTGSGDQSIKALGPSDSNFHTHDVVFSGRPESVRRALSLARKFDRPRKQVRVDVRIVEISSNASRTLGVDWDSEVTYNAVELANPNIQGNPGTTPLNDGLKIGKFAHTPIQLGAQLNALEQSGDAKVISNPTLMVLDGERSFLLAGTKYVYPTIQNKDQSGQPIYTVTTEKLGVYLQVGVQIGLDDDMVLSIYPQVTSLLSFQSINGGNYPIIAAREEQATVRATQGDVIVLGGLKQDLRTYSSTGLPFLSKLPLLGRLFSSATRSHNDDELVFFLTPKIVEENVPPLDAKIEVKDPF